MIHWQKSNNKFLLLLIVLAIVVKSAFFLWGGVHPFQGADSHSFYSLTLNFARGEGLKYVDNGAPNLVLNSFRPPLYPLFAGILFKIFGDHPSAVMLVQLMLGVLSIVVMFALAKLLFNDVVATWTAVLGVFYWTSMFWENQFYTEPLFCLLFLLANYFALTAALRDDSRGVAQRAVTAGTFYGLAVLCRPAAAAALPLVLGWMIVIRVRSDRRVLIWSTLMLGAWILIMLPWWIRNYIVQGAFVPFVTSGGLNLWGGNHIAGGAKAITAAWEIMKENPNGFSELEMDRWFYHDAWHVLSNNPSHFLALLKDKFIWYWWPLQRDFYQLPYRLLFPFFLIGLGASVRYFRKASILHMIILSQCGVSVLYNAHSRYRYSIDFYIILIAAVGVVGLANAAPAKRKWIGPLYCLIILGLGLLFRGTEGSFLSFIRLWYIIPAAIAFVALGYLRAHVISPHSSEAH
jgi:4-amino-4-deoxy-L-arabinose transferase-like glycosyltransferase